ncbi:hypothetical protein [Alicyclobacillus mengziensis]|uniref:Uncharacterized protein n=1 Tax=Alicyclobacillus mengziensis TaxID=2931921 RepID=A0A9X7Z634_9BACL|nr:hypothetical protein [Alicyclobacillus mengziensis]QSO46967.1 hypothetical protein JZ786_21535 [Alicyclobacillus mengziensis]
MVRLRGRTQAYSPRQLLKALRRKTSVKSSAIMSLAVVVGNRTVGGGFWTLTLSLWRISPIPRIAS